MLSLIEFVRGLGDTATGITILYQYYAMILGTIVTCHWVAKWGLKKRAK